KELAERLLRANFTDSEDVGNIETLVQLAEEVGIDKQKALATLQDESAFRETVLTDISEAKEFGITGGPFFILNRKYAISGEKSKETFIQALEKVWEEEQPKPLFEDLSGDSNNGAACADGSCANPNEADS